MNAETRQQAIAIAAAIFAARDLAKLKEPRELHSPRAVSAIEDAISKAKRLVDAIERKLS